MQLLWSSHVKVHLIRPRTIQCQEMLSQGALEMFDFFSLLLSRGWIADNNGDAYDDHDDGGKSFCGSPDNLDPLSTLFSG